jgi:hypothetical protein
MFVTPALQRWVCKEKEMEEQDSFRSRLLLVWVSDSSQKKYSGSKIWVAILIKGYRKREPLDERGMGSGLCEEGL